MNFEERLDLVLEAKRQPIPADNLRKLILTCLTKWAKWNDPSWKANPWKDGIPDWFGTEYEGFSRKNPGKPRAEVFHDAAPGFHRAACLEDPIPDVVPQIQVEINTRYANQPPGMKEELFKIGHDNGWEPFLSEGPSGRPADLTITFVRNYTTKVSRPERLFHVTDASNVEHIRKEGIKPRMGGEEHPYPQRAYFWTDRALALGSIENWEAWGWHAPKGVPWSPSPKGGHTRRALIEIDPSQVKGNFYEDWELKTREPGLDRAETPEQEAAALKSLEDHHERKALWTSVHIPPSAIKRIEIINPDGTTWDADPATESFQRRLDEKLGETRSRARLFVNGKETNVPSEVPDDEWVEFSMALGKRVLGDDWENCAFVTLPDDPEHITELWLGEPPPHAEDIPEERVIRLARQSEEQSD